MATKSTISLLVRMRTDHVFYYFISNTGGSAAEICWPLLTFCTLNLASFPNMEYYF